MHIKLDCQASQSLVLYELGEVPSQYMEYKPESFGKASSELVPDFTHDELDEVLQKATLETEKLSLDQIQFLPQPKRRMGTT